MIEKVRCKNCDAVIEVQEERDWVGLWFYYYRCYYCQSQNTIKTSEPFRLPKWERQKKQ